MSQHKENNIELEVHITVNDETNQSTELNEIVVKNPYYHIYWDRKGKEILKIPTEEKKDKTYIVKTEKDQDKLYKNISIGRKAPVSNISKSNAEKTEKALSSLVGVTDKDKISQIINPIQSNLVQIENIDVLSDIYNIAQSDTGHDPTSDARNREYGAIIYNDDRIESVIGKVGNPETDRDVSVTYNYYQDDVRTTAHTHPSGKFEKYFINGEEVSKNEYVGEGNKISYSPKQTLTSSWQQVPSREDIGNATHVHYVFAMGDRKVYVYTSSGAVAYFDQDVIKKAIQNKNK